MRQADHRQDENPALKVMREEEAKSLLELNNSYGVLQCAKQRYAAAGARHTALRKAYAVLHRYGTSAT